MFRFFFFLFFICFSFASFGDTVVVKRSNPVVNTRMLRSGGSGSGVTYTSVNREFVGSYSYFNSNSALSNCPASFNISSAKAGDIYFAEYYFLFNPLFTGKPSNYSVRLVIDKFTYNYDGEYLPVWGSTPTFECLTDGYMPVSLGINGLTGVFVYFYKTDKKSSVPVLGDSAGYGWSNPGYNYLIDPETGKAVLSSITGYLGQNNPLGVPDVPGGDDSGGDNTGGNTGGDNTGGDNTGGNTGGDNTGGDNTGGDNTGGDNTGGDNTGGDNTGENPPEKPPENPPENNDDEGSSITVPDAPSAPSVSLTDGFSGVKGRFSSPSVDIPSSGSYSQWFSIPLPSGNSVEINLADIHSGISSGFDFFKRIVKSFFTLLISIVFFLKTFKLFRKNS